MPDIIARFAKTNPNVELTIACEPSKDLCERLNRNELDVALVTHNPKVRNSIMVRSEPLLWVTSMAHSVHTETPVPLAVGRRDCDWRQLGCAALESVGRDYSILFTSWSSTVVASAVLAGLAVSLLPESALRPGMRRPGVSTVLMDAISDHIAASLDNMTASDGTHDAMSTHRLQQNRQRNGLMFSSW